jgi:hypothetical protein
MTAAIPDRFTVFMQKSLVEAFDRECYEAADGNS